MARNSPEPKPDVWERFLGLLRAGNHVDTSLATAGISRRAYVALMSEGRERHEQGDEEHPSAVALAEVQRAIGTHEAALVAVVTKAAMGGDAKAALAMLAARHPTKWHPDIRAELRDAFDALLERVRGKLSGEQYRRVLEAAAEFEFEREIEPAPLPKLPG